MTEKEVKALLDEKSHHTDMVNHPPHYKSKSGLESIDVIEGFHLGFCLGNTIKYILRHASKGHPLEDLEKAAWYLRRHIDSLKGGRDGK